MATCLICGNPIRAIRSSKKYCSTACKQKAYLKRIDVKDAFNSGVYGHDVTVVDDKLNVKDDNNDKDFTISDDKSSKEVIVNEGNYRKTVTVIDDKHTADTNLLPALYAKDWQTKDDVTTSDDNYHWIVPEFFEQLEQQIEENGYRELFYKVHHYATGGTIERLNTQFKSILHQLLRCSYQDHIRANELNMLHDALADMEESIAFRCSSNYPYKKRIEELRTKWGKLLEEVSHRTQFTFSTSLQQEAFRMLCEIGDTVKHIPFDTLFKHLYDKEE